MPDSAGPDVGWLTRAKPGEDICGDACGLWVEPARIVMAVADGLGHGIHAAEAAQAAIRCIGRSRQRSCEEVFSECDRQLSNTRGAALALAMIDLHDKRLTLATVGNIRAVLLRATEELHLGGARGIVGAGYDGLAPESHDLMPGDKLLLFSDGLPEFLPFRDLALPPEAPAQKIAEAALVAWASERDDAAMLVYRHLIPLTQIQ